MAVDPIDISIRSNCPLLFVQSLEEERFIRYVEQLCINARRKLWVFSLSEGLWNIAFSKTDELWPEKGREAAREQVRDPIAVLEHLKKLQVHGAVFLLIDFHEPLRDMLVQRLLKDVRRRFKQTGNCLVLLSAVRAIPPSLSHVIDFHEFPLPCREELSGSLNGIYRAMEKKGVTIRLNKGERERLVSLGQGLTIDQFETCVARALVQSHGEIDAGCMDEIIAGKKRIIRESGVLEFFDAQETMDGVGGLNCLKQWLSKRQFAFTEKAREFGLKTPGGVVLIGIQGCGKSLTAKACASLWRFPLIRLDTGRLFTSQVGGSEENTRRAIQVAEAISPCVMWIDELEKAFAGIGSSSYSDAGTAARVFGTLATWLQEKIAPVFVIATANSVTSLPPELLRKGRWDEIFFLDLPGVGERQAIIRIHLTKRNRKPRDFDIPLLAESCRDFSGAEIEQAILDGLYDAFEANRPLATEDILKSMRVQIPLVRMMEEQIQALRTWARHRARPASEDFIEDQRRIWKDGDVRKIRMDQSTGEN